MFAGLIRTLLFQRFAQDEKGSIKLLVAVATPLILLLTGVALDIAELYRARINFQFAVDAGALAAARTLVATGNKEKASAAGEEVFYGNIRNITVQNSDAVIKFELRKDNCAEQPIVAEAVLKKQVFFAGIRAATTNISGLIDASRRPTDDDMMVPLSASAEVMCDQNRIEIALVLDNSGSMSRKGKLIALKSAAKKLVKTLHTALDQQLQPEPVRFSLVPFAALVNVGSHQRQESWMDTKGIGLYHHEYLNWEADPNAIRVGRRYQTRNGQPLTRFTLYDNLPGIRWKGCVESRPYPHNTLDTEPNVPPRRKTVFVPSFAPDVPDNWSGQHQQVLDDQLSGPVRQAYCTEFQSAGIQSSGGSSRQRIRWCKVWSDGYAGRQHPQDSVYQPSWNDRVEYVQGAYMGGQRPNTAEPAKKWKDGPRIREDMFYNNYLYDGHNFPAAMGHPKSVENTGRPHNQYKRQVWTWKYLNSPIPRDVNSNRSGLPNVMGLQGGPNLFCTSRKIVPLTKDRSTVLRGIDDMQASGSTNIAEGVAWGWRTLSPKPPFSEGRSYLAEGNRKVMVVLTDGNNILLPLESRRFSKLNKSHYSSWGHSENGRIFAFSRRWGDRKHDAETFTWEMNQQMIETCDNAKAAGIEIYTIAFDVADRSSVKGMLERCASLGPLGVPLYFDARNNAQLTATFEKIAEKLAAIALTR